MDMGRPGRQPGLIAFAAGALLLWAGTGLAQLQCPGDLNRDSQVTVDELVTAVNCALKGCPAPGSRFVDNGDGTITDIYTRLTWEKKDDAGGLHDKDARYSWPMTIGWLADLNREGGTGFAGYSDWRIPEVKELQSIIDYERSNPAVDPALNTGCTAGCTVMMCSCTAMLDHWSSTTLADFPRLAWNVRFGSGMVMDTHKDSSCHVRAVRSSL